MTEILYHPANEYQKKFTAEVEKADEEKAYIVLDRTLFYKEGGGQPADHGKFSWGGGEAKVIDVQKEHSEIRHYLEAGYRRKARKSRARLTGSDDTNT